jgi:inhibitor of KinA sporulation pathway (predicted exonuclease)
MNYIVFDLEFNQGFNFNKGKPTSSKPLCPFEIIHLGAVRLDENLTVTGTFNKFVKPKIYTRLHPYVKKMTGITKADLKSAKFFKGVYSEFIHFLGQEGVLCVWGKSDIKELIRNIEYHKLDSSPIPKEYIDVQRHANIHLHYPKGISVGLSSAVELLDISSELEFHNAFNDAFYTSEVFKVIYNNKMKPETYISHKTKRTETDVKTSLETDKLFKQFEKMLNRQMTTEEKSIIKLAYNMGYTKQFQKTLSPSRD